MLVINFKGITPQQRFYSYAVQGNNKSNIIRFVVEQDQENEDLHTMSCYLKVANKEHNYIDKIKLSEVATENGYITLSWEMTRKSTRYRNLELQLQFESEDEDDIIYQSQIIELELNNTINADKEIEEEYPSELQRLNKEVKEVKEDVTDLDNEVKTKVSKTSETNKVYGTDENGNQTLYPKDSFGQVEDVKVNGESVVENKVANIDLTLYAKKIGELPSITITSNTTIEDLFNEYPNLDNTLFTLKINGLNVAKRFIVIIHKYNVIANITFYYFKILEMSYINNNFNYYEHNSVSGVPQNKKISELVSNTYKHTIADKSYVEDLLSGIDTRIGNIEELIPAQASEENKLADKNYVDTLVANIKKDHYQIVDIVEYPTLADFLASTGEEGYLYLYPIDTTESPTFDSGYYRYVWEDNAWLPLGTTKIDLSDYPQKSANETITGQWTFNDGCLIIENIKAKAGLPYKQIRIKDENGNLAYVFGTGQTSEGALYSAFYTYNNGDLGTSTYKWKDIYLSGGFNPNANGFKLVPPDTISWTANKEIATTDQVVVKANESVISDQYDNTKTYAVGDIVIYNNVLYKCTTAVTTAEDFDSTKWTATKVSELVADETIMRTDNAQTITGRKIFTDGQAIYFGSENNYTKIYKDGASIKFGSRLQVGQIFPTQNKAQDLGTDMVGTWYWRDLYLYRNIVWEDENSIKQTISMKDLFNLIAYAKSQGWIS